QQLQQLHGREPTDEELARELDMAPERVREILQAMRQPTSLDRPVGDEEDTTLGELMVDANTPPTQDVVEQRLLRDEIEDELSQRPAPGHPSGRPRRAARHPGVRWRAFPTSPMPASTHRCCMPRAPSWSTAGRPGAARASRSPRTSSAWPTASPAAPAWSSST